MPTKGYDAFFPDPGQFISMTCNVCGAQCNVTRNRNGPTSSVEAMGRVERPHDRFVCPHTDAEWHHAALQLLKEAEAETDPILKAALYRRVQLATRNRA